jgi:serine/threonine protein kinase
VAASGGIGEVHKARDTRLDLIVAIKILIEGLAGDSTFRERVAAVAELTFQNR